MTKKRILCVDDEPLVLSSLRAIFRRDRERWDVTCVNGGAAALETLDTESFDLIISDMRMPEIDGTMLLEQVSTKYPQMARILLSGSAHHDDVTRASVWAHALLFKPCAIQLLRETVERLLRHCTITGEIPAVENGHGT